MDVVEQCFVIIQLLEKTMLLELSLFLSTSIPETMSYLHDLYTRLKNLDSLNSEELTDDNLKSPQMMELVVEWVGRV